MEGRNSNWQPNALLQWCSIAKAYLVSVCTVVLGVRRIVAEVHVDAVVNMVMTELLLSRVLEENPADCV